MNAPSPALVAPARLIEMPTRDDARGGLVFMETARHVPFPIKRFFILHHVAPGAGRGHHAHKTCHQLFVAVAGHVSVIVDDGKSRRTELLDRPNLGLHVPPMIWAELADFSSDAALGVLASELYDESDYIRDYAAFRTAVGAKA